MTKLVPMPMPELNAAKLVVSLVVMELAVDSGVRSTFELEPPHALSAASAVSTAAVVESRLKYMQVFSK